MGQGGPAPAAAAAWIADRGALLPQSRDDAARLLTAWRQEQTFAARRQTAAWGIPVRHRRGREVVRL
eukprot:12497414-Alexandrium_andersonii.AAC.1